MPSEGIKHNDMEVETLRLEVDGAIGDAAARLRKTEASAQQRLRRATIEQRHLETFLDELNYRLRTVTAAEGGGVITSTGPLSETQLTTLSTQHDDLQKRKKELELVNAELGQLTSRLSWLIHQIEGACAWVTRPNEESDAEADTAGGNGTINPQPNAGDQVMWAQIIMGQEAERARLAREIHDGPAQALANTVLRLQFIEQMFTQRPGEVQAEFARLRTALQESLKDVRRFLFNLRPASLSEVGLVPTLKQYVIDYSDQFGVHVDLNLPENLVLSANQELVVFRVIQEALQNIHKHAEASKIEVNIQQRAGGPLVVTVTDNGRGFDAKAARQNRPSSSGMVGMKERAATVGGNLKIDSLPGTGTTVTLTLPMPK